MLHSYRLSIKLNSVSGKHVKFSTSTTAIKPLHAAFFGSKSSICFLYQTKTYISIHFFSNKHEDEKHLATDLIQNGCETSLERVDYVLALQQFISLKGKNMQHKVRKRRKQSQICSIILQHQNCKDKVFVVHLENFTVNLQLCMQLGILIVIDPHNFSKLLNLLFVQFMLQT